MSIFWNQQSKVCGGNIMVHTHNLATGVTEIGRLQIWSQFDTLWDTVSHWLKGVLHCSSVLFCCYHEEDHTFNFNTKRKDLGWGGTRKFMQMNLRFLFRLPNHRISELREHIRKDLPLISQRIKPIPDVNMTSPRSCNLRCRNSNKYQS